MNADHLEEGLVAWNPAEIDRLEAHAQGRLNGRVRDFRLILRGNGLILRGHAPTYYAKQLAQHVIMEESGLPIVANEIQVF